MDLIRTRLAAAALAAFALGALVHARPAAARAKQETAGARAALLAGAPARLQPFFAALYDDGEWNAVVNFERLGLAAMEAGERRIAEAAFDQALARIDAVYAADANAARARSVWSKEAVKDFKGEPYERAMAFYYRGLLYLAAGDPQNARAAFKSAEFQDTVSEQEEYQGDFTLMDVLAGWASACDGDADTARQHYDAAVDKLAARDPALATALRNALPAADADTLVLLEAEPGPRKVARGAHQELLAFEAGGGDGGFATLAPDGAGASAPMFFEDVAWQATTRGGRQVDSVLAGKASFKDGLDAGGQALYQAGLNSMTQGMLTNNDKLASLGSASMLLGLVGQLSSLAAKPTADTRYWDTLPGRVFYGFGRFAPSAPAAAIWTAGGGASTVAPVVDASGGRCRLVWARTLDSFSAPPRVAGNTLSARQTKKVLKKNEAKDQAFRSRLAATFPTAAAAEGAALPSGGR